MAGQSQKVLLPRRIQISGTRSSSMGMGRAALLAAPSSAARSTIRRCCNFRADSLANISSPTLCSGWIRVLDPSNNTASNFASEISGPVDLHVGPDGALYYLTRSARSFAFRRRPSQAMNISTRARVETGDNVLIGGFIVTGSCCEESHRPCDWAVTVAAWSNRCAGRSDT